MPTSSSKLVNSPTDGYAPGCRAFSDAFSDLDVAIVANGPFGGTCLSAGCIRRWLFADQLGPHFADSPDQPVLLIESRRAFGRRRFHRQKAHLVLSALRHRAAELGDQALYISAEDFYRDTRTRLGILMEGDEPLGGRWNFDSENREPPPKQTTLGVEEPWWPTEDAIDEKVRRDLDRWEHDGSVQYVGTDGPRRFAVTRQEALAALAVFIERRLPAFGTHEDAMLTGDDWMSHSLLSAPFNLGLLDPREVIEARGER